MLHGYLTVKRFTPLSCRSMKPWYIHTGGSRQCDCCGAARLERHASCVALYVSVRAHTSVRAACRKGSLLSEPHTTSWYGGMRLVQHALNACFNDGDCDFTGRVVVTMLMTHGSASNADPQLVLCSAVPQIKYAYMHGTAASQNDSKHQLTGRHQAPASAAARPHRPRSSCLAAV